MSSQQHQQPDPDFPEPKLPSLRIHRSSSSSSSPRHPLSTPTADAQRRVAIAVDLSDESAHAVKWAVQNYLRPGDAVVLLHVRPTSVLYGADWGAIRLQINNARSNANAPIDENDLADQQQRQQLEDDFDIFTTAKANSLAQPLVEAGIPFKIHIVKDHDMKERLCLEMERLGLSAVIMGSRGFGAAGSRRNSKGRLGSVSDYCVHHCICPVVVVRSPEETDDGIGDGRNVGIKKRVGIGEEVELHPVPEEEDQECLDASDEQKDA